MSREAAVVEDRQIQPQPISEQWVGQDDHWRRSDHPANRSCIPPPQQDLKSEIARMRLEIAGMKEELEQIEMFGSHQPPHKNDRHYISSGENDPKEQCYDDEDGDNDTFFSSHINVFQSKDEDDESVDDDDDDDETEDDHDADADEDSDEDDEDEEDREDEEDEEEEESAMMRDGLLGAERRELANSDEGSEDWTWTEDDSGASD
jgi:hypothetical protein